MTTIAIAIVGSAITLEREPWKKKQRANTKKGAKRIKSDNFTRGNREKWMEWLDGTIITLYFGGSNNILPVDLGKSNIYPGIPLHSWPAQLVAVDPQHDF